jgi:hypothetical protein
MKNFLFDLVASQPNVDGAFHGGGKYAKKIFLELVKLQGNQNWVIYGLYDSSKDLDQTIKQEAANHNVTLIDIKGKTLPDVVKEHEIKRFYTALPFSLITYGFNDLSNHPNCEVCVTIHGLRTLEIAFPLNALTYITSTKEKVTAVVKKLFQKKLFNRDKERYHSLLKNADVIAVSNHTKYSINTFFPNIDTSKLNVFYSPDVTEFETQDNSGAHNHINYFLMVSGNRWLKNNIRSAIAIDQLFSEHKNITQKVIITGVSNKEVYLSKIVNKDRFIFYGYVSESLLRELNKNAFAFIYMSLNEGFGYPPLEAMKFSIPVLTNPFTSIFEVCDNAVLYSNPYSIPEIKARVLQLLNETYHSELSAKGKQRYDFIQKRQAEDLTLCTKYLLR